RVGRCVLRRPGGGASLAAGYYRAGLQPARLGRSLALPFWLGNPSAADRPPGGTNAEEAAGTVMDPSDCGFADARPRLI
ncbi:MAG: hypothetical protein ACE5EX_10775, partial [Phycisphaerae bacterium]